MYYQSALKNGLKIITSRLTGRHSVGLAIWARVGGRHETKRTSGISHFVEHMVFKGTANRSAKDIKQEIEGVGGMFNAFTSEECTCYFVKIPRAYLEQAFDVLQDMMNQPSFKTEDIEKERTVILEEIKMYLDLPSQYVQEIMTELLWPKQPLGAPIIGTVETVSSFKRKDFLAHLNCYYQPHNLMVTACGDIEHTYIESLANKYFARRVPRTGTAFQAVKNIRGEKRFRFVGKKTEQTHFVIGFHGLSRNDPARYQLALLNVILGANMSSRLFEEVRERRGLAYEIKSGISFLNDTGCVTVSAGVETEKTPLAVRVILKELGKLKRSLVSEGELKRAKDYFLGQLKLGLEDTLDQTLWPGERVLYGGPVPSFKEMEKEISSVSSPDLRKLSQKVFKASGIHFSLIGPLKEKFEQKVTKELVCP